MSYLLAWLTIESIPVKSRDEPARDTVPIDAEAVVGDIERFLREDIVQMMPEEAEADWRGPQRPLILPSLALWAGMLVCALHGFTSQLAL